MNTTAKFRDWSKADRGLLERLAEKYAQLEEELMLNAGAASTRSALNSIHLDLLKQCPLPRTEQEIERELVRLLRESVAKGRSHDCLVNEANAESIVNTADQIRRLCSEKFRP